MFRHFGRGIINTLRMFTLSAAANKEAAEGFFVLCILLPPFVDVHVDKGFDRNTDEDGEGDGEEDKKEEVKKGP